MSEAIARTLEERARALGFDGFGIARLRDDPVRTGQLRRWLARGWHGGMEWMARPERESPSRFWAEARSVVMVGVGYGDPGDDALARAERPEHANIASYARAMDYHDPVKERLRMLGDWLVTHHGGATRTLCDTAPLMEKPQAEQAGLGWQGKHTHLVSRSFGSWLLLGALLTTHDLPPSTPETDHCGSCSRCIAICPTQALRAPRRLDARRCIAYLTIEHRGHIPWLLRPAIGNRVFGCDDCLAVCPWNKFAQAGRAAIIAGRKELGLIDLADLLDLSPTGFARLFKNSPLRRTGWLRMQRNGLIAAGNSGKRALLGIVQARLEHPSPVIRVAAIWAYGRLATLTPAEAGERAAREGDDLVRREWIQAAKIEKD